jgi:hypothetical protein
MFISKQSLLSPWEDILVMSDSLYSSLEQNTVSWDSWSSIQTWWDRSVDSIRSNKVIKPNRIRQDKDKIRQVKDIGNNVNSSSNMNDITRYKTNTPLIAGLPVTWYTNNYICIKYNTGSCDKTTTHKNGLGNFLLRHICGGCLKIGKGEDSSHPANNCKFKEQFFL